jgi:D-tyrosyl-tRNA(Tyr) deacylase
MRALIQRVTRGSVTINNQKYSEIDQGIVILLGVKESDTDEDAKYLAQKCAQLRIFEDENEKMNLSVLDIKGRALVISQFTLYGDTRKGNRPSYIEAAKPELAEALYDKFCEYLKKHIGDANVATGVFRAMMLVEIMNDGPVTVMVETRCAKINSYRKRVKRYCRYLKGIYQEKRETTTTGSSRP